MDWKFIEKVLRSKTVRTLYLWGPPGVGKTYSAYHTHRGRRKKNDLFACTVTEETPSAELRGHFVPKGGEFEWHDGPFTAAMRNGARLVINELSHASDDVKQILYPVLESAETARLTLPTKETIIPKEGFHVICTDNVPPDCLSEALRDRFDVTIEVKEPHPKAMEAILKSLRGHARQTVCMEVERRVSVRQWLAIGRLSKDGFNMKEALVATLGDRGNDLFEAMAIDKVVGKK